MGDNIYESLDGENLQDRPFYKCPINSTHNTLIRHRSLLRESVMTELNCRVIEIVLSTLKYPVFMEIDMKGQEVLGEGDVGTDCNPTEGICKIRHGFTGTSNLLDFLTTVCHAYSKCFDDSSMPYPLILGFDVTESSKCDTGIFNEITKLINNCEGVTTSGKSLICGKTDKIEKKLSGSLLTTLYGDAQGEKETTKTPLDFLKFSENANTECSEKKLSELMGKIILRCKGKTLVDELKKEDGSGICHIDYQSSSKIQVNTFNKVKYPELEYDPSAMKLLRVYPGFNANIRALSYQKTISDEIKKRLNELFKKEAPKAKGIQLDLTTGKFNLPFDLTPESGEGPKTVHGPSILKYINIVSYNYPLDTEKDKAFQELDKNFYTFYNKDDAREKKYNNLVQELVTGS